MLTNDSAVYNIGSLVICFIYKSFKLKFINIYPLNVKPECFRN